MKKLKIVAVFMFLFFVFFTSVHAYSETDILNLADSFTPCSSKTSAAIKSARATYTRVLNERKVKQSDLNTIYNNISYVFNTLNKYNICSIEQKNQLPQSEKDKLYNLYQATNNILLNSPKKVGVSSKNDYSIVIDSTTYEIKIYESGGLSDVIKLEEKLNYVGLNKKIIYFIVGLFLILIGLIVLKILKKKNNLITSLIYVTILVLPLTIIFRDKISIGLDMIDLMKKNNNTLKKEVVANNEQIISYPSYGMAYAQIYINEEKEDIYFGDNDSILKKGIGQATSSYLPGEDKTTILSGHNTGIFKNLSKLEKNDELKIETIYGVFKYKVNKIEIVKDTSIESLNKDYDLILYTCYPNKDLYGDKRIFIYADLINSEWLGENYES